MSSRFAPLSSLRCTLPVVLGGAALLSMLAVLALQAALAAAGARWPLAAWLGLQVAIAGVAALALLWWRVVGPVRQLERQARALAALAPLPALEWSENEEYGPLAAHLDSLRDRQLELMASIERKSEQIDQLATYDAVTRLPNRALLRELFSHQAAAARRARTSLALLLVDLDHFKTLNDTLGHAAGDELLRVVGRRLAVTLRESDFVCRLGGDEFAVLLSNPEGWDQVAVVAERLLSVVAQPIVLDQGGHGAQITASVGIAMFPSDAVDFDGIVRTAELAMYRSKELGRARHSFYHPDLDAVLRERAALERELLRAVTENELVLYYQPVVDAARSRLVGAEALLRWQHPQRGLLEPAAFLQAAEHTGLMREIGRWTLEVACRQLAAWQAAGIAPPRIAVNLSARQAHDATLPEAVRATLDRHGLQPSQLELEITEDALRADSEVAQRAAVRLRALGVAIAIDDFGTGHSSLVTLKLLRPDRLKIDRSFIRRLHQDDGDAALADAVIGMARSLAIGVVAEGVETAAQRDWLLDRGCPLQQGFFYGQPMPASAFERLVIERFTTEPRTRPANLESADTA